LKEIVQLVGTDSLDESEKITLDIAKLIQEDFLAQNGFSEHDRFCPFYKTVWMMKNMILFHDLAQKVVQNSSSDNKITYGMIRAKLNGLRVALVQMKFAVPAEGQDKLVPGFKATYDEIQRAFREFEDNLS